MMSSNKLILSLWDAFMNVYLLGNGFDLHHKFPTRYIDFLHTVQFLSENSEQEFSMVGDVFGNEPLKSKNILTTQNKTKQIK